MSFIIRDKVIYVTSQEKGVVVKVHTPARGRQLYDVVINGSIGQFSSSNLIADFELTDPFERVAQGLFGVRSDFVLRLGARFANLDFRQSEAEAK